MTQTIQHLVIALAVLTALAYLGRDLWRTAFAKKNCGCGSGKGCSRMGDAERKIRAATRP